MMARGRNWFGHLVPANSTILTGRLVPHGDAGRPESASRQVRPRRAVISARHRGSRTWSRATGRSGRRRRVGPGVRAGVYKQLVPNAEVTLPGSVCQTCDPMTISSANTWTPAESGGAGRTARRRDRRDPLAIGHHGPPHDPHPEGARSSGHAQGADDARGLVLAAEQRADRGGLRQYSLHGAQG